MEAGAVRDVNIRNRFLLPNLIFEDIDRQFLYGVRRKRYLGSRVDLLKICNISCISSFFSYIAPSGEVRPVRGDD